jgi:hypothetical protein
MQQIGKGDRLLVWDSVHQWYRLDRTIIPCRSLEKLGQLILADIRGELEGFRIAYIGPVTRDHFEVFCRLAWVWLQRAPGGVLVVEELSDVTSPGKAPAAWGEIVRKHGHSRGSRVFAITQRPAESDKTIVGNSAVIHSGFMAFADDRVYMARCLDVDVTEITKLPQLHWIERDMRTRVLRRGVVQFRT